MPYDTLTDLPDAVKKLPKHAQEIYLRAFNSAFEQYDGDEGKSAATAWAAVKTKYEQDKDGNWITKESKEAKMLSDKNRSKLLQSALMSEYKIGQSVPTPKNLTIDEVFDGKVIYDVDGQLYESSYELDKDGKATFGDPKKVLSTKVYKSMESLQSAYSEIIQEAGRRNANLDSSRIKKIVALCQELLSSEAEPDEKKAKEALKEATSVLKIIKAQAPMKTEDGIKYPASAFAYVPDTEKPSDWKLRLWEGEEVSKPMLAMASASLSPGGFKGQKVQIPSVDLSEVKRKIRTEYRKLGVEDEVIPKWVKEAMIRDKYPIYTPLTEAKAFDDKGRAVVIVIKAGFNADKSRYYPAEMLKRDYRVFEGLKMYADHPTEQEEKSLPERSIKPTGFVAKLIDVSCDENGTVTGVANIIEDWLMKKLANMRDKNMLSEMGISINALGRGSKTTIEGVETLVIEELTGARSVDFVTEPGANGIVTLYESDREVDIDLIELSSLRERRPDLVKLIETKVRNEITKEAKKAMENEELIKEKDEQIETLTKERDELKEAAEKAVKEAAKAEAQAIIKEAVDKAELPEAAKERLTERFKDAENAEGIVEAIQSEVDYIAKLSEAGKVKGLGSTTADTEKDKEALKESAKRLHPEYTDEQIETFVNGR